jgi:predicted enzyme related to lactoylglutathione lyase
LLVGPLAGLLVGPLAGLFADPFAGLFADPFGRLFAGPFARLSGGVRRVFDKCCQCSASATSTRCSKMPLMPTPTTTPPANQIAHFAINADDVTRAKDFYGRVFGWTFHAWGPPKFYMIQTGPGAGAAEGAGLLGSLQGRRELIAGQRTIGYECTISVASIDATAGAVLANGGKTIMPKSVIAGVGTLMFFQDPEGNVFGAMQYDTAAE